MQTKVKKMQLCKKAKNNSTGTTNNKEKKEKKNPKSKIVNIKKWPIKKIILIRKVRATPLIKNLNQWEKNITNLETHSQEWSSSKKTINPSTAKVKVRTPSQEKLVIKNKKPTLAHGLNKGKTSPQSQNIVRKNTINLKKNLD